MQYHQLIRENPNKKKGYVGRGGKRGKTSGRGTKGQKARAGRKIRPELRDEIKRWPKLRGRGRNIFKSFSQKPQTVSLSAIDRNFKDDSQVNIQSLLEKKLIRRQGGKIPIVKILASSKFERKISLSGCLTSMVAKSMIEKAGGKIEVK